VGDALALDALRLRAGAIGPLEFGDPAADVLGVLAASLGQPDADSGTFTSEGELGTCDGDTVRVVQWGPLLVITKVRTGTGETLLAFRLDGREANSSNAAAELQTASGLGLGSTVADLSAIYSGSFQVVYTTHPDEGEVFELRSEGVLVLWGPVTAGDPTGTVLGVFSSIVCQG